MWYGWRVDIFSNRNRTKYIISPFRISNLLAGTYKEWTKDRWYRKKNSNKSRKNTESWYEWCKYPNQNKADLLRKINL